MELRSKLIRFVQMSKKKSVKALCTMNHVDHSKQKQLPNSRQ